MRHSTRLVRTSSLFLSLLFATMNHGEHGEKMRLLACLLLLVDALGFSNVAVKCSGSRSIAHGRQTRTNLGVNSDGLDDDSAISQYPQVAQQFKILTCSATACSEKRKLLNMDQFATFSAFWGRSAEIRVEECSCLGGCKMAPSVAIEHDDYDGRVALEGMNEDEFTNRLFHRVITTADADRVWSIVENAVRAMAEEDDSVEDEEAEVGASTTIPGTYV